jgi:hypothetical protein
MEVTMEPEIGRTGAPASDADDPALASARDGICRAFESRYLEVAKDESHLIEEWHSFEVTEHHVDVLYRGQWFTLTFDEYPDGDFGNGRIWRIGVDDRREGAPLQLGIEKIGYIVDGAVF